MAHDIVIFSNFIPLPLTISFGALSLLANERFTEDKKRMWRGARRTNSTWLDIYRYVDLDMIEQIVSLLDPFNI